jgi:hypothetical protein
MRYMLIGFVEVSIKVWGVDPVREDKYLTARGSVSMCMGAEYYLF